MKAPQDIILTPVITEASMVGIADKKYTFYVAKNANKIEIAQAVSKLFGVDVAKVNTREWGSTADTSPTGKRRLSP